MTKAALMPCVTARSHMAIRKEVARQVRVELRKRDVAQSYYSNQWYNWYKRADNRWQRNWHSRKNYPKQATSISRAREKREYTRTATKKDAVPNNEDRRKADLDEELAKYFQGVAL